ncbi:MAG: hypothetical protein Q7S81_01330 [bacterium]|nr:hypothetical protein [bacterium]
MIEKKKEFRILFPIVLFSIFYFLFSGSVAQAATLYFSPSSGSYAVGSVLPINIYVSSADQAMNAVSGAISFPSDMLELVSLSKTSSIITLWVQEPSFSNAAGTANFEGIVLNPGFIGSSGKVITLNFKVKAAGSAPLSFSSGSVLANDGKGTNILTSLGSGQFSFGGAVLAGEEPAAASSLPAGTPSAPETSSLTHPDSDKWYSLNEAKFIWKIPSDVTGVRLSVDAVPYGTPTVIYSPVISEKDLKNLDDGISYFHAQFRNSSGWGKISHFKFKIDTQKPNKFDVIKIEQKDPTEPTVRFIFDAEDGGSGIDYYEIQIDDRKIEEWRDDGAHRYKTPVLIPGEYTLTVKATDKAGNTLTNSAKFIIKALESPKITEYQKELQSGEPLIVRGLTFADSKVIISIQEESNDSKSFTVESDQDGKFTFVADEKLGDGIYKVWAEVIDGRDARSLPTEKVTIAVVKSATLRIGSWAINFLAVMIPLVALIAFFFFMLWYGWHRFSLLRKRLRKEVSEVEQAVHKAFDLLKEDIREQIKTLEKTRTKRELTDEEEKVIKLFKSHLDGAEKFIKKEIEDIKREVK